MQGVMNREVIIQGTLAGLALLELTVFVFGWIGGYYMAKSKYQSQKGRSNLLLLFVLIPLLSLMAGCDSYSETRIVKLDAAPQTIALGEFKGNDEGITQLFADTVAAHLSAGGFKIVNDVDKADVIITGAVTYKKAGWSVGSSYWILTVKAKDGAVLYSTEFHQELSGWRGDKTPKEVINELSQRLKNFLSDAHD